MAMSVISGNDLLKTADWQWKARVIIIKFYDQRTFQELIIMNPGHAFSIFNTLSLLLSDEQKHAQDVNSKI